MGEKMLLLIMGWSFLFLNFIYRIERTCIITIKIGKIGYNDQMDKIT
ncbi:hypothetical protein QRE66_18085 [Bacillus cereus]|nr:hypothetical protein QRE66_18085 [Bacillus cereus]